jgi:hypothetical protein
METESCQTRTRRIIPQPRFEIGERALRRRGGKEMTILERQWAENGWTWQYRVFWQMRGENPFWQMLGEDELESLA